MTIFGHRSTRRSRTEPASFLGSTHAGRSRNPVSSANYDERKIKMATRNPVAELDSRFSSSDATATSWPEASQRLEQAEVYWISTVRPDGRPHVIP